MNKNKKKYYFNPPLFIQREQKIIELISRYPKISKVLEIGCGECKLMKKLIKLSNLEKLRGLDKSNLILENNSYQLNPLASDYLVPRKSPLTIDLFCADVLNLHYFPEIYQGFECFIMTEVIEHIDELNLNRLGFIIFQLLKPPMVIISTPNSEYNVLFDLGNKFRHHDHKFEWNRKQFQQWCLEVGSRDEYRIEWDGVGEDKGFGFCSQFALFVKKSPFFQKIDNNFHHFGFFKKVFETIFPHDKTSPLEKTMNEISYLLFKEITTINYYLENEMIQINEKRKNKGWTDGFYWFIPAEKIFSNKKISSFFQKNQQLFFDKIKELYEVDQEGYIKYYYNFQKEEEEKEEEELELEEENKERKGKGMEKRVEIEEVWD